MKFFGPAPVAKFPLPVGMLVLLCALYLVAGSLGHDPWKTDDAVHLGIAYGFFSGGDWLVPRIGGEALTGVAPFYHGLAATIAYLTQWALPFHDGARLASPLFGALFLYLLFCAASHLHGREAGLAAPVLAIGTLGLLVPIHDAQPASALLAASALAYLGLSLPSQNSLRGSFCVGIGIGLAFLAGGVTGVAPLLPLLLLNLRRRRWGAWGVALASALVIGGIWIILLSLTAPDYLLSWWHDELAAANFSPTGFRRDHLELLAWFTWPVLPVGLWNTWVERRHWRLWNIALPLFGTLVALLWFLAHDARPVLALPLLTPLALLAAGGAHTLRRGAANAFDWFGMMTFTLVIGLIWLGGIAMWSGWPEQIAHNFAKLAPGFSAKFSLLALLLALAFTAAWLATLIKLPRSPWRAAIRWSTGLVATWGVLIALWFPWIDYGKTYRQLVHALKLELPRNPGCIEGRNLGLPQRAVLDYFAGIRTVAAAKDRTCTWLLMQGPTRQDATPAGWTKVWEGSRPGDKGERWRLYRKPEQEEH